MRTRSGTVSQSSLRKQDSDYGHDNIVHPVLGIVLNVYVSDDEANRSGQAMQDGRGSQIEARVLVVNDGSDSPWILPNVAVPPNSSSGVDNFSEEIPKGVSGAVDESQLPSNFTEASSVKLDGDWCVVDFIGGSINQPFIAKWWPHPANHRDPTSAGLAKNALLQGRRMVKRYQGTRFAVTSKGTVLIDTSEANHPVKNGKRIPVDTGGDVRVTIKESKQLELNWNPSVFGDPDEPDFLWPPQAQRQTRATRSTKVTITKDLIEAIAGEMVRIGAQRGNFVLTTPQGNIELGAGADQPVPLGTNLKTAIEHLIDNAIKKLIVPTIFGPSGAVEAFPANVPLLDAVKAELPGALSDFVFTRKDKA